MTHAQVISVRTTRLGLCELLTCALSLKSFVSYRSETASHRPSSDRVAATRLVRS